MDNDGVVLIVDDEEDILELVDVNLRREGFRTTQATNGAQALRLAAATQPSLIILDLMLPDIQGIEVCRRIRSNPDTADIPIIMLTARSEEIDRVVGFEVGADDYVVKSQFSVRELVLRVRAVLRRKGRGAAPDENEPSRLEFGQLSIDEAAHRAWVAGEEIALTVTEFRLLWALASRVGRVQPRGRLLQDVWDMPPDLNTRTVDTHIKRLREKLGKSAGHIETVRGVGYRFARSSET